MSNIQEHYDDDALEPIAVIGMAGRFPGAKNINEFWQNLCNGVESVSFFSDEELITSGIDPTLLNNPRYVKAKGILEDIKIFDPFFFGFNPKEAEIMDVQHRIFLECAWEALENAGYDSEKYSGLIGVYAGAGMNTYFLHNVFPSTSLRTVPSQSVGDGAAATYQLSIMNDKDALATLTAYKLNLKGPGIGIQTACSTSLVAVHLACQSLFNGECDMALAGGVSIQVPQKSGYMYEEGMILSPDGHCRAFDADAKGIVPGSGCGIVVLKRLGDAIADKDMIYAVIRGSAVNNDGSLKVGYTAPGVEGQRDVIMSAQAFAGVNPETITYIETHGTGTTLGDPIEITALTQAFRTDTQKKEFCAIGSVKTNVGHLDTAAGVTGLIKTVLALHHKIIPPSLHFKSPNPQIDFENSPFYVNAERAEWKKDSATPRRAGVSSFGIGGTNAHVILEEFETGDLKFETGNLKLETDDIDGKPQISNFKFHLIVLSAKTATALDTATENLIAHLKANPDLDLPDVAYTLQIGRRAFNYRRIMVCRDMDQSGNLDTKRFLTNSRAPGELPVVFMFSGQGAQYVNMARELYETEPIFQAQVNQCSEILRPYLNLDLRDLIYQESGVRS